MSHYNNQEQCHNNHTNAGIYAPMPLVKGASQARARRWNSINSNFRRKIREGPIAGKNNMYISFFMGGFQPVLICGTEMGKTFLERKKRGRERE